MAKSLIINIFYLLGFCIIAPILFVFIWFFGKLDELRQGVLFYTPKEGGKCLKCGGEMRGRGYNGFECRNCNWSINYINP